MCMCLRFWKARKPILIKQPDKHTVRTYAFRIGAGQTEVGQNEVSSCSIGLGQVDAS